MGQALLVAAAVIQGFAVLYGVHLLSRREGAAGAWLLLLGAMCSMLAWRIAVLSAVPLPPYFNPLIAIWGSTCMLGAMFLFGREVTLRRHAESQRDALLASERAARAEAEHASRLKDDFLATLSHELRSPLAAILGWCTVLRRSRGGGDEVERALEVIERNARLQASLVEDLLDVTRLQAGALHLELAEVTLEQPVRAAAQALRPLAEQRGITIELRAATPAPRVRGDAARLQQVAVNLLGNALKFTPPGGRVVVEVDATAVCARLVVSDDGEGIDASFLPHVFARFRQADGTPTRRHGGLGLGLSIVEQLVRLHGGEVRATSAGRNQGSSFTVTLPLDAVAGPAAGMPVAGLPAPGVLESRAPAPPDVAPDAAPAPGPSADSSDALAGVRILLVDDEADVRSATSRLLTLAGAQVVALASGESLEPELLRYRPDVLLLDIGMPGEDGYALVQRVRRLPAAAGGATPAISLTAHARSEDRARALAAGFDDHLPKPIELATLVAAIRERGATRRTPGTALPA